MSKGMMNAHGEYSFFVTLLLHQGIFAPIYIPFVSKINHFLFFNILVTALL